MTTIKLHSGDMGSDELQVRCDLTQASSPVEVCYRSNERDNWEGTQYQCADARHRIAGLADIGKKLAAAGLEINLDDFTCEWKVVEEVTAE